MALSASMPSRRGRGRKRSEEHLPNVLSDITAIVDGQSQADPPFRTTRLYTRLTAAEVRRQLIRQRGYTDDELPPAETIAPTLNELGSSRKKVAKSHRVTPVGIFRPASDELFLDGVTSKVTSECLGDRLVDWWETVKERFSHIQTLLINLDTGPENHSRRTQGMQRLVDFVQHSRITIRLASYPPYQSKDNALERGFGILEQHWNGALLDSVDAVVEYASPMTWKGNHPVVAVVTTTYQTGVKLTKEAMKVVETQLERMPHLDKWFVDIEYPSLAIRDSS